MMDNVGYQNWDTNDDSMLDSSISLNNLDLRITTATNTTSTTPNYGPSTFSSTRRSSENNYSIPRRGENVNYDFNISGEESTTFSAIAAGNFRESPTYNRRNNNQRRSSIDDRTKEILQLNRSTKEPLESSGISDNFESIEANYAALLEGISIPNLIINQSDELSPMIAQSNLSKMRSKNLIESKKSNDSPMSQSSLDSFEISAGDFEVGSIAAKRMKEKSSDRRRRMSLDKAPGAKMSTTPEVVKNRNLQQSSIGGFQFSTMLSSIQQSAEYSERGSPRNGPTDRQSDEDLYHLLHDEGIDKEVGLGQYRPEVALRRYSSQQSDLSDVTNEENELHPVGQSASSRSVSSHQLNTNNEVSNVSTRRKREMEYKEPNPSLRNNAGVGVRFGPSSSFTYDHNPPSVNLALQTLLPSPPTLSSPPTHDSEDYNAMNEYSLDDFEQSAEKVSAAKPELADKSSQLMSGDHALKSDDELMQNNYSTLYEKSAVATVAGSSSSSVIHSSRSVTPTIPSNQETVSMGSKALVNPTNTNRLVDSNQNSVERIMQRWHSVDSEFLKSYNTIDDLFDSSKNKPEVLSPRPEQGDSKPSTGRLEYSRDNSPISASLEADLLQPPIKSIPGLVGTGKPPLYANTNEMQREYDAGPDQEDYNDRTSDNNSFQGSTSDALLGLKLLNTVSNAPVPQQIDTNSLELPTWSVPPTTSGPSTAESRDEDEKVHVVAASPVTSMEAIPLSYNAALAQRSGSGERRLHHNIGRKVSRSDKKDRYYSVSYSEERSRLKESDDESDGEDLWQDENQSDSEHDSNHSYGHEEGYGNRNFRYSNDRQSNKDTESTAPTKMMRNPVATQPKKEMREGRKSTEPVRDRMEEESSTRKEHATGKPLFSNDQHNASVVPTYKNIAQLLEETQPKPALLEFEHAKDSRRSATSTSTRHDAPQDKLKSIKFRNVIADRKTSTLPFRTNPEVRPHEKIRPSKFPSVGDGSKPSSTTQRERHRPTRSVGGDGSQFESQNSNHWMEERLVEAEDIAAQVVQMSDAAAAMSRRLSRNTEDKINRFKTLSPSEKSNFMSARTKTSRKGSVRPSTIPNWMKQTHNSEMLLIQSKKKIAEEQEEMEKIRMIRMMTEANLKLSKKFESLEQEIRHIRTSPYAVNSPSVSPSRVYPPIRPPDHRLEENENSFDMDQAGPIGPTQHITPHRLGQKVKEDSTDIKRLSAENANLLRKFAKLDREIQAIKSGDGDWNALTKEDIIKKERESMESRKSATRHSERVEGLVSKSMSSRRPSVTGSAGVKYRGRRYEQPVRDSKRVRRDGLKVNEEDWEDLAMDAMKQLVLDSETLLRRENELNERGEALLLRESRLIDEEKKMEQNLKRNSNTMIPKDDSVINEVKQPSTSYAPLDKSYEVPSIKSKPKVVDVQSAVVGQTFSISTDMRRRESILQNEVHRLKSQLFEVKQDKELLEKVIAQHIVSTGTEGVPPNQNETPPTVMHVNTVIPTDYSAVRKMLKDGGLMMNLINNNLKTVPPAKESEDLPHSEPLHEKVEDTKPSEAAGEEESERDVKYTSIIAGPNPNPAKPLLVVYKSDYEQLVKDHVRNEMLLSGYQRENERLSRLVMEHTTEEHTRKALFFDQQEMMNKELNRLRNETGILYRSEPDDPERRTIQLRRKSAEVLEKELEMDAVIRGLKEKLTEAESGMHEREKELRHITEKLRRENIELATLLAQEQSKKKGLDGETRESLKRESELLQEECKRLREKVNWYIENQAMIGSIEEERNKLQKTCSAMKGELIRRGMEPNAIHRLMDTTGKTAAVPPPESLDHSTLNQLGFDEAKSVSSAVGTTYKPHFSSKRSLADIKKIKELEGVVAELQDSLLKRNPNSVASLIRAATVTDSEVILKNNELKDENETLRQELQSIESQHEARLRALRQEHDRMKHQFELQMEQADPPRHYLQRERNRPKEADNPSDSQGTIRALEDELNKVRTFYGKKIEELSNKHEMQIRAMKRGDRGDRGNGRTTTRTVDYDQHYEGRSSASPSQDMLGTESEGKIREFYATRVKILELELFTTSEELGRVKRMYEELKRSMGGERNDSNAEMNGSVNRSGNPSGREMSTEPESTQRHRDEKYERELKNDYEDGLKQSRLELKAANETKLKEMMNYWKSFVDEQRHTWETSQQHLFNRLHEEELRRNALNAEIMELRSRLKQPETPQLIQYQMMRQQIEQLEHRLERREKEFMAAIEEGKVAARLERARIEAIHTQECREKDEELMRFQHELEELVSMLRDQSQSVD